MLTRTFDFNEAIEIFSVVDGFKKLFSKWIDADQKIRTVLPFGDDFRAELCPVHKREAWFAERDRRAHVVFVYLNMFGDDACVMCECIMRLGMEIQEGFTPFEVQSYADAIEVVCEMERLWDEINESFIKPSCFTWGVEYSAKDMKTFLEMAQSVLSGAAMYLL